MISPRVTATPIMIFWPEVIFPTSPKNGTLIEFPWRAADRKPWPQFGQWSSDIGTEVPQSGHGHVGSAICWGEAGGVATCGIPGAGAPGAAGGCGVTGVAGAAGGCGVAGDVGTVLGAKAAGCGGIGAAVKGAGGWAWGA